jgi:hypothetical protein
MVRIGVASTKQTWREASPSIHLLRRRNSTRFLSSNRPVLCSQYYYYYYYYYYEDEDRDNKDSGELCGFCSGLSETLAVAAVAATVVVEAIRR